MSDLKLDMPKTALVLIDLQNGIVGRDTKPYAAMEVVERAAAAYHAGSYDGQTLLVVAADHSPDVNFEAGWRSLLHEALQVQYINHHHTELMSVDKLDSVVGVIAPYLSSQGSLTRPLLEQAVS